MKIKHPKNPFKIYNNYMTNNNKNNNSYNNSSYNSKNN